MSERNVEIVRRAFEIFNRYRETDLSREDRDKAFDAFADLATPDFEYVEPPEWPGAGVHHGLDQYREVLEGFFEALSQMTAEIEERFDAGDRVVVFVRWRARGSSSGAELEMRPGQVFTLREGKITKQEVYLDRDHALEVAGLSGWRHPRRTRRQARDPCVTHRVRGVANYRIWAPWRLPYVKDASKDNEAGCIFCTKPAEDDDEANLIVHRGDRCFVILNLFPYTNGHLMVAPYDHLATLPKLDAETIAEMMGLAQRAMTVLDEKYGPDGYNAGLNQGRVAGAGYEGHIHLHVVPRWAGDTNYMPVLADTRVMPQSLEESYEALKGEF